MWRRDGRELFYVRGDGMLMAAALSSSGPNGAPRELFATRLSASSSDVALYDVADAGRRFLMNTSPADAQSVPLTITVNWASSLAR